MTTAAALRADMPASTTSVYTGAEFLDSIQDGREIYIYGERVKNVTQHPAFRNSARMVARWYDRFHEKKDQIGVLTDTGSGQLTHPFFLGSKTADDLVKATLLTRDGAVVHPNFAKAAAPAPTMVAEVADAGVAEKTGEA